MSENQTYPSPFASVGGTRHWKIWAIAAAMIIVAAAGTWTAGQYRIGRLDALVNKYEQPVTDFALYASRARAQSGGAIADLLMTLRGLAVLAHRALSPCRRGLWPSACSGRPRDRQTFGKGDGGLRAGQELASARREAFNACASVAPVRTGTPRLPRRR